MINNRTFSVSDALISLVPGAQWILSGDEIGGLTWVDEEKPRPSDLEILQEVARLQTEWDALEYQRLRALEYPDFRDYLDGVVKGDQSQIDAYIAACQAVKEKYPKPE